MSASKEINQYLHDMVNTESGISILLERDSEAHAKTILAVMQSDGGEEEVRAMVNGFRQKALDKARLAFAQVRQVK